MIVTPGRDLGPAFSVLGFLQFFEPDQPIDNHHLGVLTEMPVMAFDFGSAANKFNFECAVLLGFRKAA